MNLPVPASMPRVTWATDSAPKAAHSAPTSEMLPSNSLSAIGRANTATGTHTTASSDSEVTAPRRSTGAVPWPATTRAATSRVTSCSIGKNSPRPTEKTSVHSTDTPAIRVDGRVRPAAASWM